MFFLQYSELMECKLVMRLWLFSIRRHACQPSLDVSLRMLASAVSRVSFCEAS